MPDTDNYASNAPARNRAYRAAYESEAAKKWLASLTPDQRQRAEKLGLLAPYFDTLPCDQCLDNVPEEDTPLYEHEMNDPAEEERATLLLKLGHAPTPAKPSLISPEQQRLIAAYMAAKPKMRDVLTHGLAFLFGIGSGEEHARALGISRQRFNYHVIQLRTDLNLDALGLSRTHLPQQPSA